MVKGQKGQKVQEDSIQNGVNAAEGIWWTEADEISTYSCAVILLYGWPVSWPVGVLEWENSVSVQCYLDGADPKQFHRNLNFWGQHYFCSV